ncbi:hypothetical protein KAH37_04020, partial [bacterium]|nr:hypothetical protein [bacterium]
MRNILDLLISPFVDRQKVKQGSMPPCQMFVAAFWATTVGRPYKTSLLIILSLFFFSCSSCNSASPTDADILTDEDLIIDTDSPLSTDR